MHDLTSFPCGRTTRSEGGRKRGHGGSRESISQEKKMSKELQSGFVIFLSPPLLTPPCLVEMIQFDTDGFDREAFWARLCSFQVCGRGVRR
jgi:hypothetical protein